MLQRILKHNDILKDWHLFRGHKISLKMCENLNSYCFQPFKYNCFIDIN